MPGTKACKLPQWQRPDADIPRAELSQWVDRYADYGIGLLMGSPLPDGTHLGAVDIGRDEYMRLGIAVLGNPPSGRIGRKGAVFFVRVAGGVPAHPRFERRDKATGTKILVAEGLFRKALCVLPPTIHPDTHKPYFWIGTPLHYVEFSALPLITMGG
jgi:hypothetical protein